MSVMTAIDTSGLGGLAARVAHHRAFGTTTFALIILNAALIGVETYPSVAEEHHELIVFLNEVLLALFTFELIVRIAQFGPRPWQFFRSGWNAFDFVIVAVAYLPFVRESVTLLRLARLLRLGRLLEAIPGLRVLVVGLRRSLAALASVAVLTFVLMYVYAMIGWLFFAETNPGLFGTAGRAMLTTFQMLTTEGWNDVMAATQAHHQFGWIYFVSFILLGSFLVLNGVIAVVVSSVEEARRDQSVVRKATLSIKTVEANLDSVKNARELLEILERQLTLEIETARVP